jgi:hypothetical protein
MAALRGEAPEGSPARRMIRIASALDAHRVRSTQHRRPARLVHPGRRSSRHRDAARRCDHGDQRSRGTRQDRAPLGRWCRAIGGGAGHARPHQDRAGAPVVGESRRLAWIAASGNLPSAAPPSSPRSGRRWLVPVEEVLAVLARQDVNRGGRAVAGADDRLTAAGRADRPTT